MEKPFSRPSNTDFILSFEFWYSMTLDNTCRSIYFSRTPICKFLSWKRVHKQVSDSQGYKRWLLIQIKLKQVCSLSLLLQFSFRFKCIKSTLMMPWISVSFWTRDPQMFFFSSVFSHLEKIRVNIEKQQKRVPLIWDGSHLKLDVFLAVCYHKNNKKRKISPECGFQLRIKVNALANHKGQRQSTEPIKTHENVWERIMIFWFYLWLNDKVACVFRNQSRSV